mmetsp:Transcript_6958/g.18879  ORF Transcript_6958/g.18879 Transcript_6958/m.18879 type:complete len:244 (-) Transcript_6958:71-802(-)
MRVRTADWLVGDSFLARQKCLVALALWDVVVTAVGAMGLRGSVGFIGGDDLGHLACCSGSDLLDLLEFLRELEVGDLLRGGALEHLLALAAWWEVVIVLDVGVFCGVVSWDGEHALVLVTDSRQSGEGSGSRGTVGAGGDRLLVLLLVGIEGNRILLLLEGDGEAVVAVLLAEVWVIESGWHLDGVGALGLAAHHDVVALWRFAFLRHGFWWWWSLLLEVEVSLCFLFNWFCVEMVCNATPKV